MDDACANNGAEGGECVVSPWPDDVLTWSGCVCERRPSQTPKKRQNGPVRGPAETQGPEGLEKQVQHRGRGQRLRGGRRARILQASPGATGG